MKHNYNDNDDYFKEDKRVSNNVSQSTRNINQVKFGPQKKKETKEEKRFLSIQLISQEKNHAVGINGFEEIGLEQLMPQQKNFLFLFGRE